MEDETLLEYAESPRAAIWAGIAIALGIILHRIFFLVAAVIVLIAPLGWLAEWLRKQENATPLQRRHT